MITDAEIVSAIDEAERSLADEGGVLVEDVRKNLRQWIRISEWHKSVPAKYPALHDANPADGSA